MARFNYRQLEHPPGSDTHGRSRAAAWFADRPEAPYFIPFLAFLLFFIPAGLAPQAWYPAFYALKTITAAILLWIFWPRYTPIRWNHYTLAFLTGLFGTFLWLTSTYALHQTLHIPLPGVGYDPDRFLPTAPNTLPWARWAYLSLRVAGPTLVVPVMEELFFRDYLMRAFASHGHFRDVPVGTFTWTSLLAMAAFFGINHGITMFIPGFLYGLLMGILLIRTKSLGACIIAHGVTNWSLYLYVIYTRDWQFM